LRNGKFSNWRFNNGTCIKRPYDLSRHDYRPPGPLVLAQLIEKLDKVADFSNQLEQVVFLVLVQQLGVDLSSATLCNPATIAQDPLFFMLATYIDRLYFDWQKFNPEKRLLQYACSSVSVPLYNIGGLVVSNVLNTLDLCYTYLAPNCRFGQFTEQVGIPISSNSSANSNGTIVTPLCPPVTPEICGLFGYAVSSVRSCEKVYRDCHTSVTIQVRKGDKLYGPGAIVPAGYSGSEIYPSYSLQVIDGCKLPVKELPKVLPSYGNSSETGYKYGAGDYIRTTAKDSEITSSASSLQFMSFLTSIVIGGAVFVQ
jgi:hypothetical protein